MHPLIINICTLLHVSLVLSTNPLYNNVPVTDLLNHVNDLGAATNGRNELSTLNIFSRQIPINRDKRQPQHIITDCMEVKSEEGQYFYKAGLNWVENEVCGLYLFTEPDRRIEVHFNYLDVPCHKGGLVSFIDGWELSGEFFPSIEDHPKPLGDRFTEFCGQKKFKEVFTSSQNAALIQYRIPNTGHGFSLTVRFLKNPTPCNILIQGTDITYTLRNYNKRANCSISAIYPAVVQLVALNVGLSSGGRNREIETGILHKCDKRGLDDFVQIGGTNGLENANLQIVENVCGIDSKPDAIHQTIFCGTTTIRLVSSGLYDNSVTVSLRQATEADIVSATLICEL